MNENTIEIGKNPIPYDYPIPSDVIEAFTAVLPKLLAPRKNPEVSDTEFSRNPFLTFLCKTLEAEQNGTVLPELRKDLNRCQGKSVKEQLQILFAIYQARMKETSENESHLS